MACQQQSEEDDLALALAIQASLYDTTSANSSFTTRRSIEEDRALAQAIGDSEKKDMEERQISSPGQSRGRVSEDRRGERATIIEIEGKPTLSHQLINSYSDHCKHDCDTCRHTMQMVRLIVTEAKQWCRENMDITVYAKHFSLEFWSGDRKNKLVVQVVAEKIHVTVTNESWRMWFQRVVQESWSLFKEVAVRVVDKAADMLKLVGGPQGAIVGAALKAIGW